MKSIKIFVFLMCVVTMCFAQSKDGIQFRKLSTDQVFKVAKQEKKLVFINYSTVGCKPCKQMELEVYALPEVAKIMNENFVSVKIDPIKERVEEKRAKEVYGVTGFPTFIFLNSEGKILKEHSGYKNKEEFLALVIASLNSK